MRLENLGWKRKQFEKDNQRNNDPFNKNDLNYFCKNVNNTICNKSLEDKLKRNLVLVKGQFGNKEIDVLIDTGADVTLFNKEMLNNRQLQKVAECSEKLNLQIGQILK